MGQKRFWVLIFLAGLMFSCTGIRKSGSVEGTDSSVNETPAVSEEKKKEFEYLFIEALKQKMVGNPQKAVSLLSACLEIDPNSSAAMYELANLHILNNDLTSASLLLEKAITLNGTNKWYQLLLAKIYQQTGKNQEAADVFGRLTLMEPENEEFMYMKAVHLAKAGKFDEAISAYEALEKKTGLNDQISMSKQGVFLEAGKVKEAFAEIERLISANPGDPRYYGLLADLYKERGDKANALKYYDKILELDPDNGFVNFSLADYWLSEGDTVQWFQFTKKGFESNGVDLETKLQLYLLHTGSQAVVKLSPAQNGELIGILMEGNSNDFRINSVYAEYLMRNKQSSEARDQLLKVIENGINDFSVWEQILYIDNDLQDWPMLFEHGKAAVDLFPNQPQFYFFQAIGALQSEKYTEAISVADEGLNYLVDNQLLKGQFLFLKGEAKYKLNQLNEAFVLFDEAISLDPENFIALNNYAYYLSLAGQDLEKAERMSGRVVERFPDNATYLDTYAWVLFKKKNYSLAKFYMESALSHSEEENPTLVEHYGDILMMLGNVEEALRNWEKAVSLGSESKTIKQKIAEKKYIEE
jgi:tetratricopeptide (TPR) repeat protein